MGGGKKKKKESLLYGSDSSVSPASLLAKTAFPRKETGYLACCGFNNLVWHSQWKMWFAGKQWTEHYLSALVIREKVSGKNTSSKGTFCAALYHNMLGQVGHKVHEIREAHMSGMFYTCISADPTYTHTHTHTATCMFHEVDMGVFACIWVKIVSDFCSAPLHPHYSHQLLSSISPFINYKPPLVLWVSNPKWDRSHLHCGWKW